MLENLGNAQVPCFTDAAMTDEPLLALFSDDNSSGSRLI